MRVWLALGVAWVVGCSGAGVSPLNEPPDAGDDTGKLGTAKHHDADAGSGAGNDATTSEDVGQDAETVVDAGSDVTTDAPIDTGTPMSKQPCADLDVTACSGDQILRCSKTGWLPVSPPCQYECVSGSCSGECSPASSQCDGLQPQTCNASFQWVNAGPPCQFGCMGGNCGS